MRRSVRAVRVRRPRRRLRSRQSDRQPRHDQHGPPTEVRPDAGRRPTGSERRTADASDRPLRRRRRRRLRSPTGRRLSDRCNALFASFIVRMRIERCVYTSCTDHLYLRGEVRSIMV